MKCDAKAKLGVDLREECWNLKLTAEHGLDAEILCRIYTELFLRPGGRRTLMQHLRRKQKDMGIPAKQM